MRSAIKKKVCLRTSIQLVGDTSRESANELMKLNKYIDVLYPEAERGLIRAAVEKTLLSLYRNGDR
jgi:glutamate-5-semialdehyde dehydrogenase